MDMKKKHKASDLGGLPDLSRQKKAVGVRQLKKAVRAGNVRCVYLAENADPALTRPLAELCEDNHIQITWVSTMESLGSACGIEVGAAAAAVLNS